MLRRILIAPIRFYQRWISPMTPPSCRYQPTCSHYAVQAIEVWGPYGVWLAIKRVARCHPYHPGGYDPVPLPDHQHGERCGADGCDHDHESAA